MSLAPLNSLPQRFSPVAHRPVTHAPIERIERGGDLLGAPPGREVAYRTSAAAALSGPAAAMQDQSPALPPIAPGASFDAYA
jgi:hypothetical protein